jgi:small ligand-binding sensory domain FIST
MLRLATGLSGNVQAARAIEQVAEQCLAGLAGAPVDLLLVFFSAHHLDAARAISYALGRRLAPRHMLGVSANAVLAGDKELDQTPGIAAFAASLPGVELHPYRTQMLMNYVTAGDTPGLAAAAGFGPQARASILLADPFSVPLNTLLPALSSARPITTPPHADPARPRRAPIVGGVASGAREPGRNALILDDQVLHEGGVGITLSGRVRVDALVSQGCRPVGQPMIVTGGKGQLITALGGRPALQAISEVVEELDDRGKQLMQRNGLFLGRAVNEYKARFGRDDFLIRPILSVDKASEAIAVGDLIRIGQTVQLHVRDAETAHEDLEMLLDVQRLHEPPAGALLFSCAGRGRRFFETPDHDAAAVAHAFSGPRPGPDQAKGGTVLPGPARTMPVAGFFALGEIGPIGDMVSMHSHTASAAFFRAVPPNMPDV